MQQQYDQYTEEDFLVWKTLFERQMNLLPTAASEVFLEGLPKIAFSADRIPDFAETNALLGSITGWNLTAVPGIVEDDLFFQLMAGKKFPATTWLRKMAQLDYLEEPDMFHDVFAHVPLLTNQPFVDFLQALSQIGLQYSGNPWAIELLSRIYWFTVEFGLIQEKSGLRIYGAGILSSFGETQYCLGNQPEHRPFNVKKILETAYRKDSFQTVYYIIEDYAQLYEALPLIRSLMAEMVLRPELAGRK